MTENVYADDYGCDQGYAITDIGVDDGSGGGIADDGVLQEGEIDSTLITCLAPDIDEDTFLNLDDVCPEVADPTQIDSDFDGVGDACDEEEVPIYWAITRGSDTVASDLYVYDPIQNTATLVGSTGHAFITIKVDPTDGLLYGLTRGGYGAGDVGGCDDCLMQIDTTTAAATLVVAVTNGAHPSMAFLSDGSLYTWSENNDMFTSVNTSTGVSTDLGSSIGSWGHGMCTTSGDDILWINGGGDTYLIDPTDGAHTLLGDLTDTAAAAGWVPVYGDYGIRGDCDPDTLFYMGMDITYGGAATTMVMARLYDDAAPEVIRSFPAPVTTFHYLAMDK